MYFGLLQSLHAHALLVKNLVKPPSEKLFCQCRLNSVSCQYSRGKTLHLWNRTVWAEASRNWTQVIFRALPLFSEHFRNVAVRVPQFGYQQKKPWEMVFFLKFPTLLKWQEGAWFYLLPNPKGRKHGEIYPLRKLAFNFRFGRQFDISSWDSPLRYKWCIIHIKAHWNVRPLIRVAVKKMADESADETKQRCW